MSEKKDDNRKMTGEKLGAIQERIKRAKLALLGDSGKTGNGISERIAKANASKLIR